MSKKIIHTSERMYALLLNLYPANYRQEYGKEMQYVFNESLKDARQGSGVARLWMRTIKDISTSAINEHFDKNKGDNKVKESRNDIIMQNKIFGWIAVVTGLILLMPLITMQFTSEVKWTLFDFIVMGILIFGMASLTTLVARKVNKKYRLAVVIAGAVLLLYIWAELAVGVFTDLGS